MNEPEWIDTVNGGREWSEGWQHGRGKPYSPGMIVTLALCAKDHLDKVQAFNDDPDRSGPERCPASVWVVADRILARLATAEATVEKMRAERDEAVALLKEARYYVNQGVRDTDGLDRRPYAVLSRIDALLEGVAR